MSESTKGPVAYKSLSPNDVGDTGSHQAGMHIPLELVRAGVFPELGVLELNPRESLQLLLPHGEQASAQYIYYNNRHFGGTRNEYRVTRLTGVLRNLRAKAGDTLRIESIAPLAYRLSIISMPASREKSFGGERTLIRIGGGWTVHTYRRVR